MAHQRLRKFNTRDMYPEQTLDNDLCMVVRAGRHVFLRGFLKGQSHFRLRLDPQEFRVILGSPKFE